MKKKDHVSLKKRSVTGLHYALLFGIILSLWLASSAFSDDWINPVNLYIPICLAISPLLQYLFLILPSRLRPIVWIFPIIGIILGVIGCIMSFAEPDKPFGDFVSGSFLWSGKIGSFYFVLNLLCPMLISSCISSWRIAPSFWGKIIFTVALILLIAITIFIIIFSSQVHYLLVVAMLGTIIFVLYLFPSAYRIVRVTDEST